MWILGSGLYNAAAGSTCPLHADDTFPSGRGCTYPATDFTMHAAHFPATTGLWTGQMIMGQFFLTCPGSRIRHAAVLTHTPPPYGLVRTRHLQLYAHLVTGNTAPPSSDSDYNACRCMPCGCRLRPFHVRAALFSACTLHEHGRQHATACPR